MDESEISGISFSAHISPSDLESTLVQTLPKEESTGNEIKATIFYNHKFLSKCFNGWKKIIKKQKIININELTVIQNRNKRIIVRSFIQWQKQYNNFERLFEIGCKVQISYHFLLWKNYSDNESIMRQLFLQFLLKRRAIYESTFFNEWKYTYALEKKANVMIKQRNTILKMQSLNAFKKNKANAQQIIKKAQQIRKNHALYQQKDAWNMWRYMYKLKKIEAQYQRKQLQHLKERYFNFWIAKRFNRINIQRNANKVRELSKHHLLSSHFIKWVDRYNSQIEILRRGRKLARKTRKIFFEKYFYIWISKFNSSNYITTSREAIETLHKTIILRKYFIEWHIKFSEISMRRTSLDEAEENFRLWKLNRTFFQWKTVFYVERVARLKQRRMRKRILNAKVKRSFFKWHSLFIQKRRERCANEAAMNFRKLSLMLKAFNRLRINANEGRENKERESKAIAFQNEKLLYRAFIGWKNEHRRIARLCFLVTSALEAWSESRKRKTIQQWIMYTKYRKEKRSNYKSAENEFRKRAFALAMTSFVLGSDIITPQKILNQKIDEGDFIHTCSDSLESDVLVSESSDDELAQPKRPYYLR